MHGIPLTKVCNYLQQLHIIAGGTKTYPELTKVFHQLPEAVTYRDTCSETQLCDGIYRKQMRQMEDNVYYLLDQKVSETHPFDQAPSKKSQMKGLAC